MAKVVPARTYYVAVCNAHDGNYRITDENKSAYHATRAKAERLAATHALTKHVRIEEKKVRIKRTVTIDLVEELK